MKIHYYTLCWGDNYLNLLFNKSLNTFFSNNFNFKKNEHKLFLYTDEQSKVKKKFKSNINYLKAKKIKFEFVNYSKKINKFKKQNKISVWRFLGEYQKKSILHAKKNNALCCFIFPDETKFDKTISENMPTEIFLPTYFDQHIFDPNYFDQK